MAEPKWTVNGRATSTAGEPASEPATATAIAGEAVAAQPVKQPTPMTPLDALLTDPSFFTAEEDAEIQRTMAAHKVDRLHPVIQNSVEQLLYRRQYREDWRKYQEAQTKMVARIEDVQEKTLARVEELVTRIEAMSPDVKSARKSGPGPARGSTRGERRHIRVHHRRGRRYRMACRSGHRRDAERGPAPSRGAAGRDAVDDATRPSGARTRSR